MNRLEFMRQLKELLSDISPNEREEALQYYNDYFNDAGKENEQEVLRALGSPWQVAKTVKEGLGENASMGEFTENGFTNAKESSQNAIVKRNGQSGQEENAGEGPSGKESGNPGGGAEKKEPMPTWAIVLIVIGCICLSPVILGVICGAAGGLIGIVCALFGTVLGIGLATIILYVVAITLFIAGFGCIFAYPIAGIGLLGGGCICAAIGILLMILEVFLVGKCIPGIFQGIAYVFKKIFGKTGGANA